MHASILLLSCLTTLACSTAIEKRHDHRWPIPVMDYYEAVGKRLAESRDTKDPRPLLQCNDNTIASTVLPDSALAILPAPSINNTLYHIAVGRGTQNYTCAFPSATPAAIGAVASLYNVTCLGATAYDTLATLPKAIFSLSPTIIPPPQLPLANALLSGHHYFSDGTTATFNLHTANADYGITFNKKVIGVPAPKDQNLVKNAAPAVSWLKLAVQTGIPAMQLLAEADKAGNVLEVYRINTVGGSPPPTCDGMPASFEVPYSAEYWFFNAKP